LTFEIDVTKNKATTLKGYVQNILKDLRTKLSSGAVLNQLSKEAEEISAKLGERIYVEVQINFRKER